MRDEEALMRKFYAEERDRIDQEKIKELERQI